MKIALLGDFDAGVAAHRAIPRAIDLAARSLTIDAEPVWIRTAEVDPARLADYDALWCLPSSPYENPFAAVDSIRFARENDFPFLGTCAGYQHALLEFARNRLGYPQAQSIEDEPQASMPLISALRCRLAEEADRVYLKAGSRVGGIYQAEEIVEEYNCGFGLNPEYLPIFDGSELEFCGHDASAEPRVFELAGNRFFVGTAFQPERSAFQGVTHPLISAFLIAAM